MLKDKKYEVNEMVDVACPICNETIDLGNRPKEEDFQIKEESFYAIVEFKGCRQGINFYSTHNALRWWALSGCLSGFNAYVLEDSYYVSYLLDR